MSLVHSAVFGGARFDLGIATFSNRDAGRALAVALVVLVVRHAIVRRPHVLTVARRVVVRATTEPGGSVQPLWIDTRPPLLIAVLMVLLTRTAVLVSGVIATIAVGPTGNSATDLVLQQSKTAPVELLHSRWDAGWYASIAIDGYRWDPRMSYVEQNVAFFPAFPMIVRAALWPVEGLARAAGMESALGQERGTRAVNLGAILSVVFFGAGLLTVGRIAERDIGRGLSNRVMVVAAVAPFSVFFSAPYTESLYFLTLAGAFLGLQRQRPTWSFVSGLLLGLTRQTGFLVSIPLLIYVFSRRRDRESFSPSTRSEMLAACGPAVGAALYCLYLWWSFGDPIAWVRAQAAWGPSHRWLLLSHAGTVATFTSRHPYEALNLAAVLIALPLIWKSGRLNRAYLALGLLAVSVPIIAGVVPLARMTAPVFPLYIVVAAMLTRRSAFVLVSCLLLLLQLVVAWQFYGWRGLY